MEESEIYRKLNTIFRDIFDDDRIVVTPETTAKDIEEWDSFNHINLIATIESRFHIRFKTAELEELHSVGHLVQIIRRKLVEEGTYA